MTGPWVSELHPPARDTLAGVRDTEVPAIVARWVRAEELVQEPPGSPKLIAPKEFIVTSSTSFSGAMASNAARSSM